MKKSEILFLVNTGVQAITNHTLSPEHAYKVVKFRKALNKAYDAIVKDEEDIRKDIGIDNPQIFDKEIVELRENHSDEKKLESMEAQLQRFIELNNEVLKDEVTLDCIPMPYEEWHKLQNENKEVGDPKRDLLSGYVEDILEGVLWTAPKEEA